MIDTHCHLTAKAFEGRLDQVVADARAAGVDRMISVATTPADATEAIGLAERFPGVVYATVGLHPLYAGDVEGLDEAGIRAAIEHPACVAFGELGLDHHYDQPPRERQVAMLEMQLQLIADLTEVGVAAEKGIVVHSRDSFDDLIAAFRDFPAIDPGRFVFHCFSGGGGEARQVLDFGACISFTGIVTFANAAEVREAVKIVPRDRIMVETDAPYLTPEPFRKIRPNEPRYVVETAKRIAAVRGVQPEQMATVLDGNAERFFRLA